MRALSTLLLIVVAVLGMISIAALESLAQQPATNTPFGRVTLPPSPTPYCLQVLRNRLIQYERARVTNEDPAPLNLREGPGTSFEIVGSIPSGRIFFVLEGPRCSQRYAWYRVVYDDTEGWIAEGSATSYFVEPYLPG